MTRFAYSNLNNLYSSCFSNDSAPAPAVYQSLSPQSISASRPTVNIPVITGVLPSVDVFYSNVRSLLPKTHMLAKYISVYNPSIVAITETWLSNDVASSLFCPLNYTPYIQDRSSGRGGGHLILVKNDIKSTPLNIFPPVFSPSASHIDAAACRPYCSWSRLRYFVYLSSA